MGIERNWICVSCDRCGRVDHFSSYHCARNVGWEFDVDMPFNNPMDLCPSCTNDVSVLTSKLLHN
jgi:hypothetical protein